MHALDVVGRIPVVGLFLALTLLISVNASASVDTVYFQHEDADFWARGRVAPRSLVSIDPCLDADLGQAFARRPAEVLLWVMWQSRAWPRQPGEFERALTAGAAPGHVDRIERLNVTGPDPHQTIVPLALQRAVRELLAAPRDDGPAS